MPKLPQVSAKDTIKALRKIGFAQTSQKGSHIKLQRKIDNRNQILIIPNHKIIKKGTLKNWALYAGH